MRAKYDVIGINYAALRRPDRRIAALIDAALGDAGTILNVGAGSGSYEPADRQVVALEPSLEMIRQRGPDAAQAIRGCAESLPFADASVDASMAILTIHHWADKARGLAEMRRVTRGTVVLLTYDAAHKGSWLADYLPELEALDDAQTPAMAEYAHWLGPVRVSSVPVPHDCTDGFLHAYWRRSHAYLDARVRPGSSSFWAIKNADQAFERLKHVLDSGEWHRRYAHYLNMEACDLGYRLVVAD